MPAPAPPRMPMLRHADQAISQWADGLGRALEGELGALRANASSSSGTTDVETADQLSSSGALTGTEDMLSRRGSEIMRTSLSALLTYIQGQWTTYLEPQLALTAPCTITNAHRGRLLIISGAGTITFDAATATDGFTCDMVNITTADMPLAATTGSVIGAANLQASGSLRIMRFTNASSAVFQVQGGGSSGGISYAITALTPGNVAAGAAVALSGSYKDDLATGIEWSSTGNDPWTLGISSPSAGSYSFNVTGLSSGYQRLYVRLQDQPTIKSQTALFAVGNAITAATSSTTVAAGSTPIWTGLTSTAATSYVLGFKINGGPTLTVPLTASVAAGATWTNAASTFQVPALSGSWPVVWLNNTTGAIAPTVTLTATQATSATFSLDNPDQSIRAHTAGFTATGCWGGMTAAPASIEFNIWGGSGSTTYGAFNTFTAISSPTITTVRSYVVNGVTLYEGTWSGAVPVQSGIPSGLYGTGLAYNARAKNGGGTVLATSITLGVLG